VTVATIPAMMTAPPPELLLGRPEFAADLAVAGRWIQGRRVLITGAAGSVGWPLAHALLRLQPDLLLLLDHHEHSLFSLERSLGAARAGLVYELADARDDARLARLFAGYRPDVVVHLAAAKHVPYGERFPEGAVESNVLATAALLRCAGDCGVDTFVYPSSDKSVAPPSLYGATKRLAEALVQRCAAGRHWYVARFVNIIGTRGSVIETFSQQLHAEEALSVTDTRMTRYWMSMAEALWLLVAGQAAASGEVVMPACGDAIPVVETARRLAAWYRPETDPYPIAVTGIRPGERLHEVLLSRNERFEGSDRGLRAVRTVRPPASLATVDEVVAELRGLVARGARDDLRALAMRAADSLQ